MNIRNSMTWALQLNRGLVVNIFVFGIRLMPIFTSIFEWKKLMVKAQHVKAKGEGPIPG